jgi:hypothetical protein
MKMPNKYGSVYKKKGKRRKPWVVVITVPHDGETQKRKILGYTRTRDEGLTMLSDYHKNPFDINLKDLTFATVWIDVRKKLVYLVENGKMSTNNLKAMDNAYKHCEDLYECKLLLLKKKQMQDVIDNSNLKDGSSKGFVKTLCCKIFDYAITEYELPLLNNPAVALNVGEKNYNDANPFTIEEKAILWGLQHLDIVKIILIDCYSGLRPNELFITDRDNIFLDKDYFVTGSKTKAGKDRPIPMHPKIKHLIKYFYDNGEKYPFKHFIEEFNYQKYIRLFKKLIKELGMNHVPYDARDTFITEMKSVGADEYILKRIVGHSIKDITEKVYTERKIEDLIKEVRKIS